MKLFAYTILIVSLFCGCAHQIGRNTAPSVTEINKVELIKPAAEMLSTTVKIMWYRNDELYSTGSGVCINIREEDKIQVAYILTARHVLKNVLMAMLIDPNSKYQLNIIFFNHDKNGKFISECDKPVTSMWLSDKEDIAIAIVKNPPEYLQKARLMRHDEYSNLSVGDSIFRISCPIRLPIMFMRGAIARLRTYCEDPVDDHFLTMHINTIGGDSGSGVFDSKTHKLIGVTSMGATRAMYISLCVPSIDVIDELENSTFNFILED